MTEEVVVDASVISGWLSVDDKMQVTISEDAVRQWLEEFGDKYDTMGTTRTFTTPAGRETTVSGGTYGWSINEIAEYDVIVDAVKNGKTLEREPEYYIGGTAATHAMPDWGNTYVDVDLSAQHMWYVVDGSIALETDVVTGQPIPGEDHAGGHLFNTGKGKKSGADRCYRSCHGGTFIPDAGELLDAGDMERDRSS